MNTLSLLIYKTPSLLMTKSSNNPSLGSKFLYKILYASQTNDRFLQISLLRQSLSIKGSLSVLPQYYFSGKVSISSNFYFAMSHKTQQSTKGLGVNINQDADSLPTAPFGSRFFLWPNVGPVLSRGHALMAAKHVCRCSLATSCDDEVRLSPPYGDNVYHRPPCN